MGLYFGETEITKLRNLVPQTGLDITDMWFGTTKVYTVWETYEGTLPATINANGDDMKQYQIFGDTGGVGEEVDITGLSEPLCGIDTYTDSLSLSTGILTRKIKKLVLTGEENWINRSGDPPNTFFMEAPGINIVNNRALCTHYSNQDSGSFTDLEDKHLLIRISIDRTKWYLGIRDSSFPSGFPSVAILKSYLAAQYAAETPVTVWYALAESEVSTITVPSGLTGTLEGYLIQDGTPTPETPIYPTANGVKQADDTYSIKYGYKLDMSISDGTNTTTPIYIGDTPLNKDEYVDYQAGKVHRKSANIFDKTATDTTNGYIANRYVQSDGAIIISNNYNVSEYINVDPLKEYTLENVAGNLPAICEYDENFDYISGESYRTRSKVTIKTSASAKYIRFSVYKENLNIIEMFTLTPTDPPVPLPALPTCKGTTIVNYAGSGTAPEKVFLKYRKEGY